MCSLAISRVNWPQTEAIEIRSQRDELAAMELAVRKKLQVAATCPRLEVGEEGGRVENYTVSISASH